MSDEAKEKAREGEGAGWGGNESREDRTGSKEEKIEEESYKSVKEDSNTTAYLLGNRPDATITVPTGENNFCYDFCRTKTIVLRSNNWASGKLVKSSRPTDTPF